MMRIKQEHKVLLVDDESTMRELLSNLMRQEKCQVVAKAKNGEEAVNMYRIHRPDITFLDINMPGMDGVETLKKIREIDESAFVCMVSADAFIEMVEKLMKVGVDGFVVKPISQERIHQVVEKYRKMVESDDE